MYRVTWFEAQANTLKATGKDDTFMRSWMKVNASLTAQEESSLKAIATDCEASTTATKSAIQSLAAAGSSSAAIQQIQALINQRKQAVLSHMSQLQTSFGAARYAALDAFARRIVTYKSGPPVPPGFVPKPPPAVPARGK
ncbi:MAG: hypothetical protein WDO73_05610 [Ignavibacteriota bacterium]